MPNLFLYFRMLSISTLSINDGFKYDRPGISSVINRAHHLFPSSLKKNHHGHEK